MYGLLNKALDFFILRKGCHQTFLFCQSLGIYSVSLPAPRYKVIRKGVLLPIISKVVYQYNHF